MDNDLKPSTPLDFFKETSHVVRHLYLGITSVNQLWQEASAYWSPHDDQSQDNKDDLFCI